MSLKLKPKDPLPEPPVPPPAPLASASPPPATGTPDPEFHGKVEGVLLEKYAGLGRQFKQTAAFLWLAAVPILFVWYWLMYLGQAMLTGWLFTIPHVGKSILCFVLLGVSFYTYHRVFRRNWRVRSISVPGAKEPFDLRLPVSLVSAIGDLDYLAPVNHPRFVKILLAVFWIVPHLVAAGRYARRLSRRLRVLDRQPAAAVVVGLLGFRKKIPLPELLEALPKVDVAEALMQLGLLEEVLITEDDPPLLGLHSAFRRELEEVLSE